MSYNPWKLRLRGFIGIYKGMGLPEITIDLRGINGLIGMSGKIGMGKSTILESLLPYPEFISKADPHLSDNVYTNDAEWELWFSYNGDEYRTLVKISQAKRTGSGWSKPIEGYIYKNGSNKSETSSKISEYKKYIIDLIGPQEMTYNSIFCAQGAKGIHEFQEGDVRSLFGKFVNADNIQKMSDTAKDVKKHFKTQLDIERGNLEKFSSIKESADKINIDIKTTEEQKLIVLENESDIDLDIYDNACCISHNQKQQQKAELDKVEKKVVDDKISDLRVIETKQATSRNDLLGGVSLKISSSKKSIDQINIDTKTAEDQKIIALTNESDLELDIYDNACCISHNQKQQQQAEIDKVEKQNIEGKIFELGKVEDQQLLDRSKELRVVESDITLKTSISKEHEETIKGKDNLISLKKDLEKENTLLDQRKESLLIISDEINLSDLKMDLTRDSLNDLASKKDVLQAEYTVLREKHSLEKAQLEKFNNDLSFSHGEFQAKIDMTNNSIKSLNEFIEPLEKRPEDCADDSCDFIKAALLAKDKKETELENLEALEISRTEKTTELQKDIDSQKEVLNKVLEKGKSKAEELNPVLSEILSHEKALYYEDNYKVAVNKQFSSLEEMVNDATHNIHLLNESLSVIDESKISIAEHSLKELTVNLADLADEKDKINKDYDDKDLKTLKEIQTLKTELAKFPETADFSSILINLEEQKEQLYQDKQLIYEKLQAFEISIVTNKNKLEGLEKDLENSKLIEEKINNEHDEKDLETLKEIQALKLDLAKFPETADFSSILIYLEEQKEQLQKDKQRIQERLQAFEISIGTSNGKLEELSKDLEKSKLIEERIKKLEIEVSRWEFCQGQTGKKGLQAILIENAIPEVVENANLLLQKAYGNNFSLKILTQCPDSGKEIFEIMVIDTDGEEHRVGNKSGGQKVILMKALSLAMSIIMKNKSGYVYAVAFADEEDSKLDDESAAFFIQLYRSFLTLGGFVSLFFISHKEKSIEVSDSQLKFSSNGVEVI